MERQTVALRCRKKAATSSLADFYKDGHYRQTGYQGQVIIHNVSKSDEGLYKCKISGGGSAESWLAVRAYVADAPQDGQESFTRPPYDGHVELSILLPTVFTIMCVAVLLSVVGILQCRKHKVACFSAEMPTTGSDPDKYKIVCEHAPIAEPRMDLYANITEHRNKRVRGRPRVAETHMPIYVNITGHKKKKSSELTNVAHSSKAKGRKQR
ncbi:uncharacterized protein LOC121964666, partial [Plectropomus leopardus]|uniref:uncharacterized protein LOC121964666 n=1 Tax=Plectropomus leopardus TaxID=160734 RepID=UPI001C4C8C7C